jgi:hypothetical protein
MTRIEMVDLTNTLKWSELKLLKEIVDNEHD